MISSGQNLARKPEAARNRLFYPAVTLHYLKQKKRRFLFRKASFLRLFAIF